MKIEIFDLLSLQKISVTENCKLFSHKIHVSKPVMKQYNRPKNSTIFKTVPNYTGRQREQNYEEVISIRVSDVSKIMKTADRKWPSD